MNTQNNPLKYGEVIVVNVDMQNDFALPTGALAVKDGEAVIDPANAINAYARQIGGLVAFTQDWHRADNAKHFGIWGAHCVQHKAGAALHNDLTVLPEDTIAQKGTGVDEHGYSGWAAEISSGALMDLVERKPNIERTLGEAIRTIVDYNVSHNQTTALVFAGIATDFCVRATVLDGLGVTDRQNVDVIIVTDAIRAANLQPGDGDRALREMTNAGAILMTSEAITSGGIVMATNRRER